LKPVELDHEAEAEFLDAVGWYAERSAKVARRFIAAVETTSSDLSRWPRRFPVMDEPGTDRPIRRARVRGFPYALVFVELPEEIRVLAVAHQRRRPLYWVSRLVE